MQTVITLSILIIFYCCCSIEWCYASESCPECLPPLSVQYNQQKSTIESFLDSENGKSVFAGAFQSLIPYITDTKDSNYLTLWIDKIETEIIQNNSITTNQSKITKLAMKIDQLFLSYPSIGDAIKYKVLPGKASSSWGPLFNFMHIVNEYNIPIFWTLATTPGTKTSCLIYDYILEASKENKMIQDTLYLKGIPCSRTFNMINRILQLHYDIPSKIERINLLNLQLPNYDITVNQYQQLARAFYGITSFSCRRMKDMFANYPASKFPNSNNFLLNSMNKAAKNIPSNGVTQYCIDWWSGQVDNLVTSSSEYYMIFDKIFWNQPFASFYSNIIYLSCQKDILQLNAPN